MRIKTTTIGADGQSIRGYTLWLSADDTYNWAHREGAAWPGSTLSGERVVVCVDSNGLCDLTINGKSDQDCDSNELSALVTDHLTEDYRHLWPIWESAEQKAARQFSLDTFNPDGLFADDLWRFWQKYHRASKAEVAQFIGNVTITQGSTSTTNVAGAAVLPRGAVRVVKDLANYACNKSVAMKEREQGRIKTALDYEGICERIYARLPDWAKW